MAKKNSDRRKLRPNDDEPQDFSHLLYGFRRTEMKRGRSWNVQPMSPAQAIKDYTCPGCGNTIPAGTTHQVVWQADDIMGDESALAARRHWHTQCWRMA